MLFGLKAVSVSAGGMTLVSSLLLWRVIVFVQSYACVFIVYQC